MSDHLGAMVQSSEKAHWADKGCKVADSCLQCPLPMCKIEPGGRRFYEDYLAHEKALPLWEQGQTLEEIAGATGLHPLLVYRGLRHAGKSVAKPKKRRNRHQRPHKEAA